MIADALWLAAVLHAFDAAMSARRALPTALLVAGLLTIQAALGILTLLWQVPIGLALAHQAGAIVALAVCVLHARRVSPRAVMPREARTEQAAA
jgi:cytochrome c oxidase assembly protein subunit 15